MTQGGLRTLTKEVAACVGRIEAWQPTAAATTITAVSAAPPSSAERRRTVPTAALASNDAPPEVQAVVQKTTMTS